MAFTRISRKIVAIGDLHGEYDRTLEILRIAGVVDEDDHWSGKFDILVQVGDIVDRGPDAIKIFPFMEELRLEAHQMGDKVLSLLGNHEISALTGENKWITPEEARSFGSAEGRQKEFMTGKIGQWLAAYYQIALRIPFQAPVDNPNTPYDSNQPSNSPFSHAAVSFVHGGLSQDPNDPYLTPFPTKMNDLGHSYLLKMQAGADFELTREEVNVIQFRRGPLRSRDWVLAGEDYICPMADEVLRKTGTRRMIMGHTRQPRILSKCDGKVLIIDTGISPYTRGFEDSPGVQAVLTIDYKFYPLQKEDADSTHLWQEEEVVSAVYVDRVDPIAEHSRVIAEPACTISNMCTVS